MNLGKLGHLDDAEKALRAAIALEPDSFRAYKELGRLLWTRGESLRTTDPDRAKADFAAGAEAARQALALWPDQATSHVILGLCLRGLGKRKEALAAFRAAVDCGPDVSIAHLHLGEELAEAGKLSEARTELERAAQLASPGDDRARAALAKLKK
jgi:tetratricopeptide (TPR) repeat protein